MPTTIRGLLTGALLLLLSVCPTNATVIINKDYGGVIDEYVMKYEIFRSAGDNIIIDGECDSACTLLLGIIPKHKMCVTPRAKLGFHSGALVNLKTGERKHSQDATERLWLSYPKEVKALLRTKGFWGQEHPELVYVEGAELRSLIPQCEGLEYK
jgi:hypothetical protein